MILAPEELQRLTHVQERLREVLRLLDARLTRYKANIDEEKTYLWENRDEMDHIEKVFTREFIQQSVMTGEAVLAHKKRITALLRSPYFGRFDFRPASAPDARPIYVGVHHFADDAEDRPLVYDWRAPISTMFYEHETGPARYAAPNGPIDGDILLKTAVPYSTRADGVHARECPQHHR